jgi:hypothetical protein
MATGQSRYSGHCGFTRRRTVPSSRAALALAVSHASSAKACEVGLELGVTSLPRRLPTLGKWETSAIRSWSCVLFSFAAFQLSPPPPHVVSNHKELELTVQVSLWPPISAIRAEISESGRMALPTLDSPRVESAGPHLSACLQACICCKIHHY